jgi:hypothetical protein
MRGEQWLRSSRISRNMAGGGRGESDEKEEVLNELQSLYYISSTEPRFADDVTGTVIRTNAQFLQNFSDAYPNIPSWRKHLRRKRL